MAVDRRVGRGRGLECAVQQRQGTRRLLPAGADCFGGAFQPVHDLRRVAIAARGCGQARDGGIEARGRLHEVHEAEPGGRHRSHQEHSYLSRSRYGGQIRRYESLFPRRQILPAYI